MCTEEIVHRFDLLHLEYKRATRAADCHRLMITERKGDDANNCKLLIECEAEAKRLYQDLCTLHLDLVVRLSYRHYKALVGFTGGPWF